MKSQADQRRMGQLREAKKILKGETGSRFYHRALSPKAKGKKKSSRKVTKKSRRGNRR